MACMITEYQADKLRRENALGLLVLFDPDTGTYSCRVFNERQLCLHTAGPLPTEAAARAEAADWCRVVFTDRRTITLE